MSGSTSVHLPALSEVEFEVLGEHVFCDDEIVIDWRVIESLPGAVEAERRERHNEKVLRALALVEEHDDTQSEDSNRAEIHRLEGKIDLLLDLVTALVTQGGGRRSPRHARFNTRGLCWDSSEAIEAGSLLDVDCFLAPNWPLPIKICARVRESVSRGVAYRICTRIEGLSGPGRDWLGKLVFRRHRRTVAQRRLLD